jgi:hypothetical protein
MHQQERQPKRYSAATLVPALYYKGRDDELRSTAAVNLFLAILMLGKAG